MKPTSGNCAAMGASPTTRTLSALAGLSLLAAAGTAGAATITVDSLPGNGFSYSLAFPVGGNPAKVTSVEGTFHLIGTFTVDIPEGTFTTPNDRNGWVATAMSITLRLEDGDTADGNFDKDRIFPVLGISPSTLVIKDVPLNGFPNGASATVTNTRSLSSGTGTQLAQLLSNATDSNAGRPGTQGVLSFYMLDSAFSDNSWYFYRGQANQFALSITLSNDISVVPIPATLPLLLGGIAATALLRRRR